LTPKLLREYGSYKRIKGQGIEDEIREEFATRGPIMSETRLTGSNPWEWYFLMQHFGAPTRLLDWTGGALIGLYFAVRDNPGYYDAAVWVLDPFELNYLAIRQDVVISPSEPGTTQREMKAVKSWLPERFARNAAIPSKPVAVYPTQVAQRMSTQQSCFTVHGSDLTGIDRLQTLNPPLLFKIVIPSFRVPSIRKELETAGIDEATIFPDLDGLGRTVCARWKLDSPAPNRNVHTRLGPSKVHKGGVGVFAIRNIREGADLFLGDNDEILWVREKIFSKQPAQIRELYGDFAIEKGGWYGCPLNFNRLTMSWYINEPKPGDKPNVRCVNETYDFCALRDIRAGEELTVDYLTYSGSLRKTASSRKRREP
jgi:hypothetical protein